MPNARPAPSASSSSSSGAGGPDQELKKAFTELQAKMVESRQKMQLSDLQVENLKRSITHSQLTSAEVEAWPEDTRVYETVGRMFLLSSRTDVNQRLKDKQSACHDKIKSLQARKELVERELKDSENSLRELIMQKKAT